MRPGLPDGQAPKRAPLPPAPEEPKMLELPPLVPQLTAKDRCDCKGCGARAYIRVTFESGELYFCGHHGREKHVEMLDTYIIWHDETGQIGDKRAGL